MHTGKYGHDSLMDGLYLSSLENVRREEGGDKEDNKDE
jgi:hypothetical protein